ncbi:MAG: phosphoglucosamine mutase [Pirellulaceae bacterium]
MSEPIISVSGLRGTIGEQLTPAVASRYMAALASSIPVVRGATVVLGRDGRESGAMLSRAVAATLQAHGLDVVDLGVAATPTVGVAVRKLQAAAGVQISASHNPREYNGLKLFNAQGRVFPKLEGEQVLAAYRANQHRWVPVDDLGGFCTDNDPHSHHLKSVLATVDVDAIKSKRFKVLLDSNHGAGGLLGAPLLQALGCQLTLLGGDPDGQFSHPPEPLAENLTDVSRQVCGQGYDVVFCQDPDADRLAVIDENGLFIGEEFTLALCLMQMLPQLVPSDGGSTTIVTNCATSSLSKVLAAKYDCKFMQSAVGEANVADLMIAEKAVFGGEGNGGPIDPAVGYVRDSFVGMARILELMATSGASISELVQQLPPLSMIKDKATLDSAKLPALLDRLTAKCDDAASSRLDGLKLDWPDRWLLVRGSNTEPIVRFIAEAPTTAEAQQLCDLARQIADGV